MLRTSANSRNRAAITLSFAVLVAAIAACGNSERPASGEASGPPTTSDATRETGSPAHPAVELDRDAAPPAATAPLPDTRLLQVFVEGQTEQRNGRLFRSPQGYAIYVLPQIEMVQEEPCCDLAHARFDGNYFMRIERIAPDTPLDDLREDASLALSSVGVARDAPVPHGNGALLPAKELHLTAHDEQTSMDILVIRAGDGRYRATLHLPHGEGVEGIAPTLWAMLGSLQTTGPSQRP